MTRRREWGQALSMTMASTRGARAMFRGESTSHFKPLAQGLLSSKEAKMRARNGMPELIERWGWKDDGSGRQEDPGMGYRETNLLKGQQNTSRGET